MLVADVSEPKKIQIPKPVMINPKLLKIHPKNVKFHDEKQLHDLGVLYEMIGFTDPIIVDNDNLVWAGNGSLQEALEKNMPLVPIIYMPDAWTEQQKQVFMLMDNKITESPWDFKTFKPIFDAVSPALSESFVTSFTDLIEFSSRPNPEDWSNAFKNEGDVLPDSVQMTFNIPVEKIVRFKEFIKAIDDKNKDKALMKMYQFCKKNMKS